MNRSGSKGRGRETEIETFQPEVKLPEEKDLKIDEGLYEEIRGGPQSKWPPEAKIMACTYYSIRGSYDRVAKDMAATEYQVPRDTIAAWCNKSNWWKPLTTQIRKANDEEFDAKMTGIIHKSADQLKDRVENGNLKPTGKKDEDGNPIFERHPLTSTELARDGIGIMYDKRALGRGAIIQRRSDITTMQALHELKIHFEKMSRNESKAPIEAVKTEYTVEENKS